MSCGDYYLLIRDVNQCPALFLYARRCDTERMHLMCSVYLGWIGSGLRQSMAMITKHHMYLSNVFGSLCCKVGLPGAADYLVHVCSINIDRMFLDNFDCRFAFAVTSGRHR